MNPYWLLVPVFLLCIAGSGLSYTDGLRRSSWYVPWMVALSAACGGLFALAAVRLDDKERVYCFSLAYDSTLALAYYLLPLIVFGTRVSPGVLAGAALVVAGLLVVKVWG